MEDGYGVKEKIRMRGEGNEGDRKRIIRGCRIRMKIVCYSLMSYFLSSSLCVCVCVCVCLDRRYQGVTAAYQRQRKQSSVTIFGII